MRDIRPARSSGDLMGGGSDELYEASEAAKNSQKSMRQGPVQHPRRPLRKKAKTKMGQTGSNVPVSKIHVPTEAQPRPAIKAPNNQKVGSGERKAIIIVFVLVILAGLIASYLFLPTAKVSLQLKTAPLIVDEKVSISRSGAVAVGEAYFREVAVAGVIPVTNKEKVGTKANGPVRLVNRANQEQPIREQSRLVTGDGQLFYMQQHAIIPPNSSALVPIEAAEAGPDGNLEPQRLNFASLDESSRQLVYAEVEKPLTGGSGEELAVVSEADLEQAQRNAGEVAKTQVESEIRRELPAGWSIIEESWMGEIKSFAPKAAVGDRTPELGYDASVVVRVMGFEQEQLANHLRGVLNGNLDDEFMLFPGPINYTKKVDRVDWDRGETVLDVRVTHTTMPNLNLDTLKEKLAGRTTDEAKEYLEGLPGVVSADLELWPFWVQIIPRIEKRISLELTPEKQPGI